MKQITELIDQWTHEEFGEIKQKLFGYTELVTRNNQTIPLTIPAPPEKRRIQVSLDNSFDLITWMRLSTEIQDSENENYQFGKNTGKMSVAQLRLVIAHRVELGEEFILKFDRALPYQLKHPDYKFIFLDEDRTVDGDHENVYRTELGPTEYEKHRISWNIYAIGLRVEFIYCK